MVQRCPVCNHEQPQTNINAEQESVVIFSYYPILHPRTIFALALEIFILAQMLNPKRNVKRSGIADYIKDSFDDFGFSNTAYLQILGESDKTLLFSRIIVVILFVYTQICRVPFYYFLKLFQGKKDHFELDAGDTCSLFLRSVLNAFSLLLSCIALMHASSLEGLFSDMFWAFNRTSFGASSKGPFSKICKKVLKCLFPLLRKKTLRLKRAHKEDHRYCEWRMSILFIALSCSVIIIK